MIELDALELGLSAAAANIADAKSLVAPIRLELDNLNAALAMSEARVLEQSSRADMAEDKVAQDLLLIDQLRRRIAELEAQLPPTTITDWHPIEPNGGGGWNGMVVMDDGRILAGSDVGGCVIFTFGEGARKANRGLPERHVAGLTKLGGNRVLGVFGTAGKQDRAVRIFDGNTDTWGPIITSGFTVRSQNSAGWGSTIGSAFMRSVGRLIELRPNGDLVCGTFQEGVQVWSSATRTIRTVVGTEGWAVRTLVADSISGQYIVSVWGKGCWSVNVDTGQVLPYSAVGDPDFVEYAERGPKSGQVVMACRNDGLRRGADDVTMDLPRDAWWFRIRELPDGTLQATSCQPKPFKGAACTVVELKPGAAGWTNISLAPDFTDGTTGEDFWRALDAREKMMGGNDATFVSLGSTADGRTVTMGGGVLWTWEGTHFRVQCLGFGIMVMKAGAYHAGRDIRALAVSDFNVLMRYPGEPWVRETAGLAGGSNEGTNVEFVGDRVWARKDDGTVYSADVTSHTYGSAKLQWRREAAAMPDLAPSPRAYRDGNRVFLDGVDITAPALEEFGWGDMGGGVEMIGDEVWVMGHGVLAYGERAA